MNIYETDVIVVGSGVAGLYLALSLDDDLDVIVITKQKAKDSNSYLAQGGMAVLRDDSDFESYMEDTLKAGHYENRLSSVDTMIKNSRSILNELADCGVSWDFENGKLSYTREGGHSKNRIVHNRDETGKEILTKLIDAVELKDNIRIMENTNMVDLVIKDNRSYGVVALKDDEENLFYAKKTVLATGGIGGLYRNSTNYEHIDGEGIALAMAYGAEMKDLSYVQFHPTTLEDGNNGRKKLLTEALRGEGAYIVDPNGERFLDELMPRDKVTNEIKKIMMERNIENVYLTMNHLEEKKIKKRFPYIVEICEENGFKLWEDKIPIVPSQHYYMGGIYVDENSKSSIDNLFAVGECSCNGVHGRNRLASNSLLESMVFGKVAAQCINKEILKSKIKYIKVLSKDWVDWLDSCKRRLIEEIGDSYEVV